MQRMKRTLMQKKGRLFRQPAQQQSPARQPQLHRSPAWQSRLASAPHAPQAVRLCLSSDQLKRTKKRSGRRERERQARRAHAAHQEQEADRPAPAAAAFGDGFKVQDSKQAWAEGALAAPTASQ